MRIANDEKRAGYFWIPENPDRKLTGTLYIEEGGYIRIEVFGNFDEKLSNFLTGENDELKRIHGYVAKIGELTLENCYYERKEFSIGIRWCYSVNN